MKSTPSFYAAACWCLWMLLVCLAPARAEDPRLVRGPYLQMPNASAVTICWRTELPGTGTVRYGKTEGQLTGSVVEAVPAVDHQVRLTGLTPATHYFYQVETGETTLAEGASFHFYTPPADGAAVPVRFWALGDCGTASLAQRQVRDAFAPLHAQRRADLMLFLGDNAYYSGMDSQYQVAIFDMYTDYLRALPAWACIGNHETYSEADELGRFAHDRVWVAPADGECGGVVSGTTRYYSWNHGPVHFISLDSMTSSRAPDGPMGQWLIADLAANLQPWVVAFWHHPPYSRGSHNSDYEREMVEMRENMVPILEANGVDLILTGHSHCYERSYLMDSHYGPSNTLTNGHLKNQGNGREDSDGPYYKASAGMAPHEGAVYITAGSSGQVSGGTLDHPAHFISLNSLGSVVVDVDGTRMDVRFLRESAAPDAPPVFDDSFTIIKGVPPPQAPVLTRGPYLQMAAPSAMTVRWRTDVPSGGRVRYGPTPAAIGGLVEQPGEVSTEHSVRITGLTPGTKYYYRVESGNAPSIGGPGYFFRTPPAPGSPAPVRVWALGDAGTKNAEQRAVRDAFAGLHSQKPADVWLLLGNNAASQGSDADYQAAVFGTYQSLLQQAPVWSCLGEQETAGPVVDGRYAWDQIFEMPAAGQSGGVPSGSGRYYSWNHGNIHFVALDSVTSSRAADGPMARWLAEDLQANTLPWTIAFWHHPPYSKGSHNSDTEAGSTAMRQNILPILEEYGVDLVLCAHSESYERSVLLDGHYGLSGTLSPANRLNTRDGREDGAGVYVKPATARAPHSGTVYVVAGSSGKTGGGALNHPAHLVSLNQLGSVVVDVTGNRMDVRFLRESEEPGGSPARFDDYFTILKGGPPVPLPATGLAVLQNGPSSALLYWQDNSDAEERYEVEIASQGGGFINVATLGPGSTGCEIAGLNPGMQYSVVAIASNIAGTASSAALNFQQPPNVPVPSRLEQWRFLNWGAVNAAGERADLADPDGDGSVNLMEYALGSSPRNAQAVPELTATLTPENKLALSFQRQDAPELTYTVEFSSSLNPGSWAPAFSSTGGAPRTITVVDPSPLPGTSRFARLKVTLN